MKIFLIGMPGCGKSTLGRPLSEILKIPFFDLDSLLEDKENNKIRDIFQSKGEEYFRTIEAKQLQETINKEDNFVLATGGGTPCFYNNLEIMKKAGKTIFLKVSIEILASRLQTEGLTSRPLLKEYNTSESLFKYLNNISEKRIAYYQKADIVIKGGETTEKSIETILADLKS